MRLVRDDTNKVIPQVFENLDSKKLTYTGSYGAITKFTNPVGGAYLYANGTDPVTVKFNGESQEIIFPPGVQFFIPLVVASFNAKSTADGDLYIWGGY